MKKQNESSGWDDLKFSLAGIAFWLFPVLVVLGLLASLFL